MSLGGPQTFATPTGADGCPNPGVGGCARRSCEQEIGLAEGGLKAIAPLWTSAGAAQPATGLEPAIIALLEPSFQPLEFGAADVFEQTVAHLESEDYRIRLTV